MGSWFSNLHIRKNENITKEAVAAYLSRLMVERKYLPAASAEEADAAIALVSGDGDAWVSVYSEVFVHDDPESCAAVAAPISEALHTDVLGIACFDSDYLYLNLINPAEKTDAWVGIGRGADVGIKRRNSLTAWKKKVADYPAFSAGAKARYDCADMFLQDAAQCLDLTFERSTMSERYLQELDAQKQYLYFRYPEDPQARPVPCFWIQDYSLPCLVDRESHVVARNMGAESRGLTVYFLGPFVEYDEITFSDVCLKLNDVITAIELTKVQLSDGQWAYSYHNPDFYIPPQVPRRLSEQKWARMVMQRQIALYFVPRGNARKALDITVVFVPDENPAGQGSWNVWQKYGSKKAFIEHHNKLWKRIRAIEPDENACLPLLKEDDFD